MQDKDLGISKGHEAREEIYDLKIYGDIDSWQLLCKASAKSQGWMKSTKVLNIGQNCVLQVTTQQTNHDGTYSLAEAVTFVTGANIDITAVPRRIVPTCQLTPMAKDSVEDLRINSDSLSDRQKEEFEKRKAVILNSENNM